MRPIGPVICAFGAKAPMSEADEQHGADAEREAAEIDLADQVAEADGEEDREDRLGADDVTRKLEHDTSSAFNLALRPSIGQRARQPAAAKLLEHALAPRSGCGGAVFGVLVVEVHAPST